MQFRDLLDAIRKNRPPAIDGHEGRRSVEIIQAIYKAAESGGKVVKLPLQGDPVHRVDGRTQEGLAGGPVETALRDLSTSCATIGIRSVRLQPDRSTFRRQAGA